MKSSLKDFAIDLKLPYLRSLLLIALIPLLPEYISFFLAIGALIFACQDIRQRKAKIRLGAIGKILLAYCAYVTVTAFFSEYRLQCVAVAAMWWFFFLVYLIVVNLLIDQDRADAFLMCITGVAGIIGLIACIQYRLDFFIDCNYGSAWGWLDKYVFEYLPLTLNLAVDPGRAHGTFSNPNMLAQYLVMVSPFVICFNFIERRRKLRLFSRISLFLTFAGILFSFSRGGYIALLVLAIALIVINIRRRFATVTLYVISALLFLPEEVMTRLFSVRKGITHSGRAAGTISTAINNNLTRSVPAVAAADSNATEIVTTIGDDLAISERFEIWHQSIGHILERPFFGYGVGTEPTANLLKPESGIPAPHAHNIVLQLLLEGGIFALILMCIIGFLAFRKGYKLFRSGNNSSFWMGFAVLGFVVCFILHGMVDYPLTTPRLIACFVTILGIIEQSVHIFDCNTPRKNSKNKNNGLA